MALHRTSVYSTQFGAGQLQLQKDADELPFRTYLCHYITAVVIVFSTNFYT